MTLKKPIKASIQVFSGQTTKPVWFLKLCPGLEFPIQSSQLAGRFGLISLASMQGRLDDAAQVFQPSQGPRPTQQCRALLGSSLADISLPSTSRSPS
jgi:hypothetical protein